MALVRGHLVGDRYRLTERIAIGGMGEVWRAADQLLGRQVAVKLLRSELDSDDEFLARFRVEARTAALINHRNIAAVHDYGEDPEADDGSTAFLVMELVAGQPLSTQLAIEGRLSVTSVLDLLEQAGRALRAAHEHGFVHRDVKPGNILLARDGAVKLTDFGIAKAANTPGLTSTGLVLGTAHYIAPEQAQGQDATAASDVYSLGVVGYECLAGYRPFDADSAGTIAEMHVNDPLPALPAEVPAEVRKLIEYALVKNPARRYRDGTELVAAVAEVRRGQPAPVPGSVGPARLRALAAHPGSVHPRPRPHGDPDRSEPAKAEHEQPGPAGADDDQQRGGPADSAERASPERPSDTPASAEPDTDQPDSDQPDSDTPASAEPDTDQPDSDEADSGEALVEETSAPDVPPLPSPRSEAPPQSIAPPARSGVTPLTWAFIVLIIAAIVLGVVVVRNALRAAQPGVAPPPAGWAPSETGHATAVAGRAELRPRVRSIVVAWPADGHDEGNRNTGNHGTHGNHHHQTTTWNHHR